MTGPYQITEVINVSESESMQSAADPRQPEHLKSNTKFHHSVKNLTSAKFDDQLLLSWVCLTGL